MGVAGSGDDVLDLMGAAHGSVVIVAPYMKSAAMRRLLKCVPESVQKCTCITRWAPEDIVSGACDLEIFDDVSEVIGGRLFVHPHLHAKYYSNGERCLVGSANLTGRGLGWSTPSNIELLVALPRQFPGLVAWESALLNSAIEATVELREQIGAQAEQLRQAGNWQMPEVEDGGAGEGEATIWVPECPAPDLLWTVYCGRGEDSMVSSAFEAAQRDLAALALPQGLAKPLFEAYVSGVLRQMPFFGEIDSLASTGLADTQAHQLLAERMVGGHDHRYVWRVVKRWLVCFFPSSYLLETGEEVLIRGKKLPKL